jgi:hypothetical protein
MAVIPKLVSHRPRRNNPQMLRDPSTSNNQRANVLGGGAPGFPSCPYVHTFEFQKNLALFLKYLLQKVETKTLIHNQLWC